MQPRPRRRDSSPIRNTRTNSASYSSQMPRRTTPRSGARPRRRPVQPQREGKPFLLKIFLWLGVLLICFVLGYLGATLVIELMSKKLFLKPENIIENQEDLTKLEESEVNRKLAASGDSVKQISLVLYHVINDTIAGTRKNFVARTQEDNIRDAFDSILSLSDVPNYERIKLLHVFRNAETAFLDVSGQFSSSLSSMGQRRSLLLLTGIVRTVQENFSPISQIRFLIDSKTPSSSGVVDLSVPWKMPERS